ncbi:protein cereblon [Schistocerca nitens]|uniref:protein cereblon n=1 Tax=Schistocerca nitens TaxID=7011 RepID=UPI002117FEBF|nr:protein cereblon [Schistocerca nitens]
MEGGGEASGAMVPVNSNDSSSEDEGDTKDDDIQQKFDTALPAKHTYLGDLEEVRGRIVLDDGSLQTIPILPQPGVVLVPGQTLPLTVFYPPTVSMLRRSINTDRIFGVICIKYVNSSPATIANVGTTAEIYEFQDEESDFGFRIKAKGRQRFRVIESNRQVDGNIIAKVKILPEVILPDPLKEIKHLSLNRLRQFKNLQQWSCLNARDAVQTRWPIWVYMQYQTEYLIPRIMHHLQHVSSGRSNVAIPKDPVELSFWVAQNLPIVDEQRLRLLSINSAVQRLRLELCILERCKLFCCSDCGTIVARKRDVFPMSVEGPQGTYVNPGGYVHETMTLYKVQGLELLSEEPDTEYSWFPGYGWTIAQCRQCHKHMGWKFTAVKKGLKPDTFWCLCRRSLAPKLSPQDDDDDTELVIKLARITTLLS